jgi:nucleotide-binding universal stress UspA family protein
MFSIIVVGTDGSEPANAAVALAVELARPDGATVHLVHAVKASPSGVSVAQVGSSIAVLGDSEMTREVRAEADAVLARAAAGADGVKFETRAAAGSPADALMQVAKEVGADLIVVGSKGMQGTHRLIGSVPNSIAHGASCNVLIAKTT